MGNNETGRAGEDVVCGFLADRGWTVLARNWRYSGGGLRGELDVIARAPDGMLAIVEVKTRSGTAFGTGFDAVTPRKVAQLRALTSRWLAETEGAFAQVRIDVASVYTPPGGPVTLEYRAGVA
ncbi:YraN family protein [Tsukamurella sp. M9C]|uniref:YraN family protein n=1 Tax=unclassified Tsukamurella TaxID=2633480 RepID=UPI001CCC1ADD|nr:YraN family protein [Tsukamurella sp. M9C]MCA0158372.1 YraN family protein [Tsukamurella sp. M9C]